MMVSINITAYNHEKYVEQAVNSVLMQKVNFDYEILIGEDDSTDNTKQLVIELAKKHPDKIKLFFNNGKPKAMRGGRKVGMFNFIKLLKNASGKYIALLDGDDYWTDPFKLQKQVDYMEAHPDCSMTFHDVLMLDEKSKLTTEYKFDNKILYDINYAARNGVIAMTCSIMVRNFFHNLEKNWDKRLIFDESIHFYSLMYGYVTHINGIMGAYRITGNGVWTSLCGRQQHVWNQDYLRVFLKQFDKRFHPGIRERLFNIEYQLSLQYFNERKYFSFLKNRYYAINNSARIYGFKYTINLIKHTIKYILGFIT